MASSKHLASTLCLLVAGCTPPGPISGPAAQASGAAPTHTVTADCDAVPAQSLIGQSVTPNLLARAGELAGVKNVRTLRPGQAVTMEFNPQRLNLELDAQGVIRSVRCG